MRSMIGCYTAGKFIVRSAYQSLPHHIPPSRHKLEPPAFSAHYALLLTQGKTVGDHCDELGIRRLALDIRHGVAEELLQNLV